MKKFIYKNKNYIVYYLAEKEYNNYRNVRKQIWHREDGPARIWYDKDGNVKYEDYWLDSKLYNTKEEYDKEMKKRNTKIGKELYE